MSRTNLRFFYAATLIILASACSSTGTNRTAQTGLTSQEFLTKAVEGNLAEIQVSQLALTSSQNPQVRSFAQRMIDDHKAANEQLASAAGTGNLKMPDHPNAKHEMTMQSLNLKSGPSFDTAYVQQMTQDHDQAIALFQAAASSDKVDPQLKAAAEKIVPTLDQHRTLVAQLQSDPSIRNASTGDHGSKER